MPDTNKMWPGETDDAHPELFNTIPPQTGEKKPGQLNDEQLKAFFHEGFVVISDFFDKEKELEPVKKELAEIVDFLAKKLFKAGKIKSLHDDKGLENRLTAIESEFPGATILMHKIGRQTEAIWNVWNNPRILNVVEQLIGTSDIQGHPVWNIRPKTPGNEATTVPWHQDIAYLDSDSYSVLQPAAWIPLIDSNRKNGCMEMVRRGHHSGKIAKHTGVWRDTWYVMLDEQEMENKLGVNMETDVVLCDIPYGGLVLFNNLIPHRSLNNESDEIRWSLDLRWQRSDKSVGFHGLKEGVVMRKSGDPTFIAPYKQPDSISGALEEEKDFDTVIGGPWIRRWEITHPNRHSEAALKSAGTAWHSAR